MSLFDIAFKILIAEEGGYVNNPRDPGGETKYGISKRAYPGEDIAGLTLDRAKSIYHADYWDRCRCGELPRPVAVCVFDCAVNQGAATAVKLLQEALGLTKDGVLGPKTLAAAYRRAENQLCADYMTARAIRYTKNENFDSFGRGWIGRLFRVLIESVTLH